MTPLLTLVTSRAAAKLSMVELAKEAVAGGVDMVQVREPDLSPTALSSLVEELIGAIGRERVAVNDAPELAALLGVHLHLPERSMAGFVATDGLRSVSCAVHAAEALTALPVETTYVVAGHLFPTASHPGAPPLGLDGLRSIVDASSLPVVAIGGMTLETAPEALRAGAAGVAVMSYVNSSGAPGQAARQMRDAMERWMTLQAHVIRVQVNGKLVEVAARVTLSDFLAERNLHPRLVVVERNREIVGKSAYDSTLLVDGDLLEIAHFVGGG